jgi:hypothetical protein
MTPFSCILESLDQLKDQRQGFVHRNRSSQHLPFHQFHDDRPLFDSIDCRDVGVIERRQDLGLVGEAVRDDFDGDVAIELGVGGAVHGPHAALPELGGDAVVGDSLRRAHSAMKHGNTSGQAEHFVARRCRILVIWMRPAWL